MRGTYEITNTSWLGIGIASILTLIAGGMILKKAGESPWKILIPIYGAYCLYKISNSENVFRGILLVAFITAIAYRTVFMHAYNTSLSVTEADFQPFRIAAIVAGVILLILHFVFSRQLAKAFGKGTGFAFGLFLLFPIFAMILGFGSAEYVGRKGLDKYASSAGNWKCSQCGCENPVSRVSCSKCGAQKQ